MVLKRWSGALTLLALFGLGFRAITREKEVEHG